MRFFRGAVLRRGNASVWSPHVQRLRRLRHPRVVVVAPGWVWGELYASDRRREAGDVIVLSGIEDVPAVAGTGGAAQLRLRRCDRVEWLPGWHEGPGGEAFATSLERYAAAGGFGAARHVFVATA